MRAFLTVVLLAMAAMPLVLLRPFPPEEEQPPGYYALAFAPVSWEIDCTDEVAWNGYIFPALDYYCTPGLLTKDSLNARFPRDFYGALSSYAPGIMEIMESRARVARGHGVALTTCGMMGYTVWLRLPGENWRGPFTVVDCSQQAGVFYHIAAVGLAVEVGYTVGQAWTPAAPRVDVHVGGRPSAWDGICLADWWVQNALEWEDGYGLLQHDIVRSDGTIEAWPPLE